MASKLLEYATICLVLTLNVVANDQVPLNASPVLGTLHRFLRNESRVIDELQVCYLSIFQDFAASFLRSNSTWMSGS